MLENTVLKWKASSGDHWKCRLFGHVWSKGWWGGTPYFTPQYFTKDGLGTRHIYLKCRCDRCNKESVVGITHDWGDKFEERYG